MEEIGDGAFYECSALKDIVMPSGENLKRVGSSVFYNTACYNEKSNWEDGVLYCGSALVDADDTVTECAVKEGTTVVADKVFARNSALTSVSIPDGVKYIGRYVFKDCTNLRDIAVPDSVEQLGMGTFEGTAYYNEETNWIDGVLYVGNHAIRWESLQYFCTIREGTKTIAEGCFKNRTLLRRITIPDSVTWIGRETFHECMLLQTITIPKNVTTIYDSTWKAFRFPKM